MKEADETLTITVQGDNAVELIVNKERYALTVVRVDAPSPNLAVSPLMHDMTLAHRTRGAGRL